MSGEIDAIRERAANWLANPYPNMFPRRSLEEDLPALCDRVEQLEAALREFEWRWNDDAITAAEFELWAMTEYHDIVFAALDGEGTKP